MSRIVTIAVLSLAMSCAQPQHTHTIHGCSPFQASSCFGPFPNAWFEQGSGATPTHERVSIPQGILPQTSLGEDFDTTMLGAVDGFSPATQIVVYFPQGVDATQLTPLPISSYDDRAALLGQPDSPLLLVDVAAKQRVPFFAELDANVTPGQRQALLIHPMSRLKHATRYAVAVRTSLHDATGKPLAPEGQFASWATGKLTSSDALWEISDRLDADATALSALGVSKGSLALMWDFDTASEASTTGQLKDMVAQAMAVPPGQLTYTVESSAPDPTNFPNALRVVIGTFQSPSFETGADPSPLAYDANHVPTMGGPASWRFVAVIPKCAQDAAGPLPLLMLGHGLFGTAWGELSDDDKGGLMQKVCMVAVGTNWVGLSGGVSRTGQPANEPKDFVVMATVLNDPNTFDLITGRLQQGHVNFQVLTRLAKGALASDAAFVVNGHAAYDPSQTYYWGASNGGIQGATFLSLSNSVDRGVLNVPGGAWSLLMWRSYDFTPAYIVLQATYPDPYDQQLIMAFTQSLFDKTDPVEFAPLMNGTAKHVLFQESQGDAEVNNLATRIVLRTIGVHALGPQLQPVAGLPPEDGPLDGLVYAQWSVDPSPVPPFADSPSPNNTAHDKMRWVPEVLDQTAQFLQRDGKVVNTCTGPCVFPSTGK